MRDGQRGARLPAAEVTAARTDRPGRQWAGDIARAQGARRPRRLVLAVAALAVLLARLPAAPLHAGTRGALRDIAARRTDIPVRAVLATFAVRLPASPGRWSLLAGSYHVLGTDRTGNDVLYQSLKSMRTAFVIGTLATMATLPFAVVLGILAGYFRGWVDEAIQYVYTTLTSVPNVLLIAACVLMVQVYLDKHPEMFETGARARRPEALLLCVDPRPHRLGRPRAGCCAARR